VYELVTLYGFVGIVMIGMSRWIGHVVRKGRQLYRNVVNRPAIKWPLGNPRRN